MQGAAAVFGAGERGQRDGGRVAAFGIGELTKLQEKFVTVFAGHADVAQDHIGMMLPDGFKTFGGAGGGGDGGVAFREHVPDQSAGIGLIVDDQNMESVEDRGTQSTPMWKKARASGGPRAVRGEGRSEAGRR